MGASLAQHLGKATGCNDDDCKALLAAGAGAGLATAFNAPIAGAVFVLEELVRRFDPKITITTLGASASAIAVARFLVGQNPVFHVPPSSYPGLLTFPVHLLLGIVAGFLGLAYNRAILGALRVTDWFRKPPEGAAAAIGALAGLTVWFAPALAGGGEEIVQRMLDGTGMNFAFALIFIFRFSFGAVSYAARTPGGLFAPMLVLGLQSGLAFGSLVHQCLPNFGASPRDYAIVGMAAFFTAVVRAPVTGIILAIELTGSFTLLLPMLAACFAAMLVPTLLRNLPIYDSLRWNSDAP
jgi:CIC family chloride channel protein